MEGVDNLKYSTQHKVNQQAKKIPSMTDWGKNPPDWKNILKEPPSNSSDATLKELKIVQESSSKAISAGGKTVDKILTVDKDMNSLFLQAAGVQYFTDEEKKLMEVFYEYLYPIIFSLKIKFDRPRPYQLGSLLNTPVEHITTSTHHTASYPSGHAAYGAMMARILSYTRSEKSQEFYEVQNEIAEARVQQGVHYPSDNLASFILVETIWKFFKNNVLKD